GAGLNYPYHIHKNQGTHYLAYKIHTLFNNNVITKEYRYKDGIQHLEGKGFMGFRKTMVSDPYESIMAGEKYVMKNIFEGHFWTTKEYDYQMDNALVSSYYGSLEPNSVFSRTETVNERFDKGNSKYLILPTLEISSDFLQDFTITKSYEYDETADLLLEKVITDYDGISSSVETYEYKPENTVLGGHYFF